MARMEPFEVACIQCTTQVVREVNLPLRDQIIQENLDRAGELIDFVAHRFGTTRLIVLPEYGLQGMFRPRTVTEWIDLAARIPGPETEFLGRKARQVGAYIVANLLEYLPDWPGRYWNCTFIVSPEGKVILKYHKENGPNNMATTYTAPGDVYSAYVERYGAEAVLPVVETEIGRLGCMTCGDVVFPEAARCLAMKGAEIIIHPTSEPYMSFTHMDVWDAMKQSRAYENMAYLVSCNVGSYTNSNRPVHFSHGGSAIVGYDGRVIAQAGVGETVVRGVVDIAALRHLRRQMTGHAYNPLFMLRAQTYGAEYNRMAAWPNDGFLATPIRDTDDTRTVASRVQADLARRRLIPPME